MEPTGFVEPWIPQVSSLFITSTYPSRWDEVRRYMYWDVYCGKVLATPQETSSPPGSFECLSVYLALGAFSVQARLSEHHYLLSTYLVYNTMFRILGIFFIVLSSLYYLHLNKNSAQLMFFYKTQFSL